MDRKVETLSRVDKRTAEILSARDGRNERERSKGKRRTTGRTIESAKSNRESYRTKLDP